MVTHEQPSHLSHSGFSSGPLLTAMSAYKGEHITEEEVNRLDRARVVFADHALLQHDFPQLRDQALLAADPALDSLDRKARGRALDALREAWLLEKAAYISTPQALGSKVNSRVPVSDVKVAAFRPFHYGRALIFSVAKVNKCLGGGRSPEEPGLLDVKGVGVRPGREPSFNSHSNGLLDLSEALREVLFQKLIDFILVRNGCSCRTVPNYGVIDTGFNRVFRWKGTLPAGILVRRAHRRPAYQWGIKDPHSREVGIEREIELLLRRYGLTSTGADTNLTMHLEGNNMIVKYGDHHLGYSPGALEWIIELTGFRGQRMEFDGMNLQFTREVNNEQPEPQIVDFGSFFYKTEFTNPLVSLVACRPVRIGDIIRPHDPLFVQPNPALIPPPNHWTRNEFVPFEEEEVDWDVKLPDPQDAITATWALDFRSGRLSGAQVAEKIEEYLATVPDWSKSN